MERERVASVKSPIRHRTQPQVMPARTPARSPAQSMRRLQHSVGNQAVQGLIQAKLEVSRPGDSHEQEADRVAQQVATSSAPVAFRRCACGGLVGPSGECAACRQKRLALQRAGASAAAASPVVNDAIRSGGQPLDNAARDYFEPRFGQDFSQVRVHTDADAHRSAELFSALAYTSGQHIVFRAGHYQPGTTEGRKLLAHELTHTLQQEGGDAPDVQREVSFDIRTVSVTPEQLARLSDAELAEQSRILREHMRTLDRNSLDYQGAQGNQRTLDEAIASRTLAASGLVGVAQLGPQVPRPPGLPMNRGFTLQPMEGLPQAVIDSIPEGQLTTLTPAMLQQAGVGGAPAGSQPAGPVRTASPASPGAPVTGISARPLIVNPAGSAYVGLEANLLNYGLPMSGASFENSIGIVGFPRWTPGRVFSGLSSPIPEHPVLWGHSAVTVRINGRIAGVISYAPSSLTRAGLNIGTTPAPNLPPGETPSVRLGTGATPAAHYSDRAILLNTKLRSIEYGVPREMAEQFLRGLPRGQTYGLAHPTPGAQYTAIPSEYYGLGGAPESCPNCIDWAVPRAQQTLGGPIATAEGVPVTDLPATRGGSPVPHQANQGRMMEFLASAERNPASVAPIRGPTGEPLPMSTGGLSTGMQVLKWGGRIMLVYAAYSTYAEIRDAPPEERGRTAAGALTGFAGGFAAGAAAGLVCGPGALACSLILGAVFGFAGYLAARDVGELAYEAATGRDEPLYTTRLWRALNQPVTHDYDIPRTACPGVAQCHVPARYLDPNWRQREFASSRALMREMELSDEDRARLIEFALGSSGQPRSAQSTR